MTFTFRGRRYRLNTQIWKDRAEGLAMAAIVWAMLIAPIALYLAPRW